MTCAHKWIDSTPAEDRGISWVCVLCGAQVISATSDSMEKVETTAESILTEIRGLRADIAAWRKE